MVITNYNPEWVKQFNLIKKELEKSISLYEKIEHVGSTSIVGMKAKPIIDIDIEIKDAAGFDLIKQELENIGYEYKGNQGIQAREVFKRCTTSNNTILDSIKHHLYICPSNSSEYKKHIVFRDYLRSHSKYVEKYNAIKDEILKRFGENDREKYVKIKEQEYGWFFDEVLELSNKDEKIHPAIAQTWRIVEREFPYK